MDRSLPPCLPPHPRPRPLLLQQVEETALSSEQKQCLNTTDPDVVNTTTYAGLTTEECQQCMSEIDIVDLSGQKWACGGSVCQNEVGGCVCVCVWGGGGAGGPGPPPPPRRVDSAEESGPISCTINHFGKLARSMAVR
jgi:hypothetical protein